MWNALRSRFSRRDRVGESPKGNGVRESPKSARARELPERLARQLGWRYSLDAETLARLRCVTKRSQLAGKDRTLMRVFDPSSLRKDAQRVRDYADLDALPSAVRFEGQWLTGQTMYGSDLRPPQAKPQASEAADVGGANQAADV